MRIRVISWSILLCISCFLIGGCSKSTSPGGTITGRVTLEGQTDHSGGRVSLYLSAQLDQKILDLNEKYPYIKTFISQGTEFDHWLAREVGNTSTGKDGSFELKDVGKGDHILVAQKEGYGWRYVFDVAVNSQLVGGGGGGRSVAGDAAWLQDPHNAEMGSKRWMRKSSALYSS